MSFRQISTCGRLLYVTKQHSNKTGRNGQKTYAWGLFYTLRKGTWSRYRQGGAAGFIINCVAIPESKANDDMQNGVGVLEHAADIVAAVLDPLVRCGPARDCHCSVATGRRPKGFRYICGMNRADMMWHVCVGMLVMMQEMSKLSKVGHILDRGIWLRTRCATDPTCSSYRP